MYIAEVKRNNYINNNVELLLHKDDLFCKIYNCIIHSYITLR